MSITKLNKLNSVNKFLRIVTILTILLTIPVIKSRASHIRAADLSGRPINDTGLRFEFTLILYRDVDGIPPTSNGIFDFGDGNSVTGIEPRSLRVIGNGDDLTEVLVYQVQHTYTSSDIYKVSYKEPNRNASTRNMASSDQTPFYIESVFNIIRDLQNSSPVLTIPPIDLGRVGQKFIHNPGAYDYDGDSLSYKIVVCKQDKDLPVNGYTYPDNSLWSLNNETGTGKATFSINPKTGDLVWDAPAVAGQYNVAFYVTEFRKTEDGFPIEISNIHRDMQIIIQENENNRPTIEAPRDTCIVAGSTLTSFFKASDPDGHSIFLEPQDVNDATLQVKPWDKATLDQSGQFSWATSCDDIRAQPYNIIVKASDRPPSPLTPLVDFATWQVTVVGPPAESLTATADNESKSIDLQWPTYACERADSVHIWRKIGSIDFNPEACETGVPGYLGYEKIKDVAIKDLEGSFKDEVREIECTGNDCASRASSFITKTRNIPLVIYTITEDSLKLSNTTKYVGDTLHFPNITPTFLSDTTFQLSYQDSVYDCKVSGAICDSLAKSDTLDIVQTISHSIKFNDISLPCDNGECIDQLLRDTLTVFDTTYYVQDTTKIGFQNFTDFTAERGINYCYRIHFTFPYSELGISMASEEACAFIRTEAPYITKVDINKTAFQKGEIRVEWKSIPNDTAYLNKDKFEFRLKKYYGFTKDFNPVVEPADTIIKIPLDSTGYTFTETATQDTAYCFQIDLVSKSNNILVDSSATSSTIWLKANPISIIRLEWDNITAYGTQVSSSPYHYIYRTKNDNTGPFYLIDSVDVTLNEQKYVDRGTEEFPIEKLQYYKYYVDTRGSYDLSFLPDILANKSQVLEVQVIDTVPPCPPIIVSVSKDDCIPADFDECIGSDCSSKPTSKYIDLRWRENKFCETYEDDVDYYNIYYKEKEDGEYTLLKSNVKDTFATVNLPIPATYGCFVVTAIDLANLESEFSAGYCIEACPDYLLPNTFSPNGDGKNDLFIPCGCPYNIEHVNFKVFNRQGVEVFNRTDDVFLNWDGKNNTGQDLNPGVYYYSAEITWYSPFGNNSKILKGWVQIFR